MPRGVTPTRVRRRQSDAKWRASVAMCYNIMKYVIPNQKVMRRRKVSKAFTLKETERHIVNLEKKLREIIEERAPMSGKVVILETEGLPRMPATFENIKNVFAERQYSHFANNTTCGKKRYNIPADIESSLLNMSHQSCKVTLANRSHMPMTLPRSLHMGNEQKHLDLSQYDYSDNHFENLLASVGMNEHESPIGLDHQTPSKETVFPSMLAQQTQAYNHHHTSLPKAATPRTPTATKRTGAHCTPKQQSQYGYRTGFTPVKLPSGLECRDLLLSFSTPNTESSMNSPVPSLPQTPGQSLHNDGTTELTDEESSSSLLCYESINFEDSLCFRKEWPQQDFLVPENDDMLDSDLNDSLPFYEAYTKMEKQREFALSTLLDTLSPHKEAFSTALTSDPEGLPSDLLSTDIKPFTKLHFDTVSTDMTGMTAAFDRESLDDLACLFMSKDSFQSDLVPTILQDASHHVSLDAEKQILREDELLVPNVDVA